MRHLSEGGIRRLLDDPDAVPDSRRAHLKDCPRCQALLDTVRADMETAGSWLSGPAVTVSPELAYRTVAHRLQVPERRPARPLLARFDWLRYRQPARPLAAVAGVALVGLAAAFTFSNVSQIFQPTQVAPITITRQDLQMLPNLAAYGTQTSGPINEPRKVADLAAAEQATGLKMTLPGSLPAGVSGAPSFSVVGLQQGRFTFSAAKAAAHARALGKTLPPMPAGMDGATIYVSAGPAIVATYGQSGTGSLPSYVVSVARAPKVSTDGSLTVAQIEDYVMSQPGFPASVAQQIRSLGDPTKTLPIPIPAGIMDSTPVTVHGVPGVSITEKSGLGSAVVWESKGLVHVVGGMISQQQAMDAASRLD